ncbi:glucosamine-6-phosphate deaminase [Gluconobacter wancherniae]|uniref:glucosamine-6-phosphate deaminase n=1 Tax=Gluconobacter wancherniae TaxID=1307955 RepID=UPI001B8AA3EE|nr:glucosamine-6-phosphate deaminase [Gluconobacter wancherniae]MBS1088529.1 glucosamine-6-phosphate deaminase [Gluconobacter wancherniae]
MPLNVIIAPDTASAFQQAATFLADHIRGAAHPVLGLATGRTMESIYALLVSDHQAGKLDFSQLTSFNLDEYVGLSPTDPRSYRHYMQEHLFGHVNMRPEHVHVPDGTASDLVAECAAYEAAIQNEGGLGLQLLGIGETGHIGFNEPPSAFDTRTRPVTLDDVTRRQNAAMFGGQPGAVPHTALTMGVGTILEARELLLVATGSSKARIVAEALLGPLTPDISASAIRLHANCTVILDHEAAAIWKQQKSASNL